MRILFHCVPQTGRISYIILCLVSLSLCNPLHSQTHLIVRFDGGFIPALGLLKPLFPILSRALRGLINLQPQKLIIQGGSVLFSPRSKLLFILSEPGHAVILVISRSPTDGSVKKTCTISSFFITGCRRSAFKKRASPFLRFSKNASVPDQKWAK